jgi:hypothetical protein
MGGDFVYMGTNDPASLKKVEIIFLSIEFF